MSIRTPGRNVRVPDDLWERAKYHARRHHTTISAVIVALLDGYVRAEDQRERVEAGSQSYAE